MITPRPAGGTSNGFRTGQDGSYRPAADILTERSEGSGSNP